ncbi:hypothetical protein ACA910_013013 [Epithemia clementina (nom. ined.)]
MIRGVPRLGSQWSAFLSRSARGFLSNKRLSAQFSALTAFPTPASTATQKVPTFCNNGLQAHQDNRVAQVRQFSSDASQADDEGSATASNDSPSYKTCRRSGIRNVAIIAHVDHGKTTLVDKLLVAARRSHDSESSNEELSRLMDSGDLEKERGITITSKITRVDYKAKDGTDMVLNIVDTPGHADFSGEVDRILSMVDGVCLLVDAVEGPMTQTKYVLSRALSAGLKPIVVLNKCDRAESVSILDSGATETRLNDLFVSLKATDDQLDYITCYASARQGWIVLEDPLQALDLATGGYKGDGGENDEYSMRNLLEAIVDNIPQPLVRVHDIDVPEEGDFEAFQKDRFSMTVVSVGYDSYLGRTCTGRIFSGSVGIGDSVKLLKRRPGDEEFDSTFDAAAAATPSPASIPPQAVAGMFCFRGVSRTPLEGRSFAGDCVTLAGVPESVAVGDTITSAMNPIDQPLYTPPLVPPTLSMEFGANNGPLAGRDGTIVTSSKIRERLFAETDNNVTLKAVKSDTDPDKTTVFARGELQLGILVEQMRREGFEIVLSPPKILTWTDPKANEVYEPFEEVTIDVDTEYAGTVVSSLTSSRKGVLKEMTETSADGKTRLIFEVSSRGLLGFNSEIAAATRGSAVVNHIFLENRPHIGLLDSSFGKSKLVANAPGKSSSHALSNLSARGILFIPPGVEVYSGMVVGENAKPGADLEVNAVRTKEVSNMRSQIKEEGIRLSPPKEMTLEEMIGYMAEDEMIEVTPKSIRLRKAILDANERERKNRTKAKQIKARKK